MLALDSNCRRHVDKIKYIAAYQTNPVSAITHYAPVSQIEPYERAESTS